MKFCLLVIFGCVVAGLQQNATENDPDNTTSDTTTVAGAETVHGEPLWKQIIDKSQLVMTCFGVVANVGTIITLTFNDREFSAAICFLLKHQSFVDALVCLFTAILMTATPMWVPGISWVDTLLCHLWHGQFIYWSAMFVSIWNLVFIAAERFLAVCHPFKHNNLTKRKILSVLVAIYLLNIPASWGGTVQTRVRGGTCVSEFLIQGPGSADLYQYFAIGVFFFFWALPAIAICYFYGRVVFVMRKRQSNATFQTNTVIDKATTELTKTAILVTAIFILCLGFDNWFYVLGYSGVVAYVFGDPLQVISVWLATLNCCINPLIYVLLMPRYRRCVVRTFVPCCTATTSAEEKYSQNTVSSAGDSNTANDASEKSKV